MAGKKLCTPAQIALGWVLARGEDIVPIPGTKRPAYLEENLNSLRLQFTPEELRELEKAFPPGAATGERYDANGMKTLNH